MLSLAAPVHGRQAGQSGKGDVLVYLDSVDAIPGTKVSVPLELFFTAGQEIPLESARVTVCVSEEFLRFEQVEAGSAARGAEATVEVRRSAVTGGGCSPIEIEIAFAKPPQRGMLATLVFAVKADAPTSRREKVRGQYAARMRSGQAVDIEPSETEIAIVARDSIVACFFYMH